MGADQAADTLLALQLRDAERAGETALRREIDDFARRSVSVTRADRHPLRGGPRLGRCHHPPHETRLWLQTALELLPTDRRDSAPACFRCEMK